VSQVLIELYDIYSRVNGVWNLFHDFDFTKLQRAKLVEEISGLEAIGKKQEFLGLPKSSGSYAIYGYFLNSAGTTIGEIGVFTEAFSPILSSWGVSTKIRRIILSALDCPRLNEIRAIVLFAIRQHAVTANQVFVYRLGINQSIRKQLFVYAQHLFETECKDTTQLIKMVSGND
jgi:hypothetical protein